MFNFLRRQADNRYNYESWGSLDLDIVKNTEIPGINPFFTPDNINTFEIHFF
jgi:hypothetical protein